MRMISCRFLLFLRPSLMSCVSCVIIHNKNIFIIYRWKVLPQEQRDGIKNYVVGKVITVSSNEEVARSDRVFLSKLNLTLVQILKQEWPHNWPTFIPDLVGSSKTSEVLCENNMQILKLLSERCVCAPQYLSAGTCTSPMVSFSLRYSIGLLI